MITADRLDRLHGAARSGGRLLGSLGRCVAAVRLAKHPEAAATLATLVIESADLRVVGIARRALLRLTDPRARDRVFELAIESGSPRLNTVIRQAGHLPAAPWLRTAWLFLEGRYEEASELDFDGSLRRAVHRAASPPLQRRIAEHARVAGRVEWIRAVADRTSQLGDLSDSEWETTLRLLADQEQFADLWRLAAVAPLPWAAKILQELGDSGWQPEAEAERSGFASLVARARRCAIPISVDVLYRRVDIPYQGREFSSLVVSPRGDRVAWMDGPSVVLCSLPAGQQLRLPMDHRHGRPEHSTILLANRARRTVLVCLSRAGASLWEVADDSASVVPVRQALTEWGGQYLPGQGEVGVTPDGTRLIRLERNGYLKVWNLATRELIIRRRAHRGYGRTRLAISPNGRLLVTRSNDARATTPSVRVWNLPMVRPVSTLSNPQHVSSLMITPNSRTLVTVTGDAVAVYALPSGQPIVVLEYEVDDRRPTKLAVAMSMDGSLLVAFVGSTATFEVRRLPDCVLIRSFPAGGRVTNPYYHQQVQGLRLTVSSDNRTIFATHPGIEHIQAWHLATGQFIGNLKHCGQHSVVITGMAPGGQIFGTVCAPEKCVATWVPEPALTGDESIATLTVTAVENLQQRCIGADAPWGQLLAALFKWQHRHDIAAADADGANLSGPTDIDLSG